MSEPILSTPIQATAPQSTAITLRIPRLNMQLVILLLLAVVTLFQTIQLWSLKGKTANISVKAAGTPANSSAPAGGTDNGLQGMVGGC